MLTLKATKTERYAQAEPSAPQVFLIKGELYDLPIALAKRVVELDGGELVEVSAEKSDEETEKVEPSETPGVDVDTKEGKKAGTKRSGRTPGKTKN